jgi:transposase
VSRQCNAWKADNNIPILPWPAQSPDINVIENVWRVLKIHINGGQVPEASKIGLGLVKIPKLEVCLGCAFFV